jgi:hypothetical protein
LDIEEMQKEGCICFQLPNSALWRRTMARPTADRYRIIDCSYTMPGVVRVDRADSNSTSGYERMWRFS